MVLYRLLGRHNVHIFHRGVYLSRHGGLGVGEDLSCGLDGWEFLETSLKALDNYSYDLYTGMGGSYGRWHPP